MASNISTASRTLRFTCVPRACNSVSQPTPVQAANDVLPDHRIGGSHQLPAYQDLSFIGRHQHPQQRPYDTVLPYPHHTHLVRLPRRMGAVRCPEVYAVHRPQRRLELSRAIVLQGRQHGLLAGQVVLGLRPGKRIRNRPSGERIRAFRIRQKLASICRALNPSCRRM